MLNTCRSFRLNFQHCIEFLLRVSQIRSLAIRSAHDHPQQFPGSELVKLFTRMVREILGFRIWCVQWAHARGFAPCVPCVSVSVRVASLDHSLFEEEATGKGVGVETRALRESGVRRG
jgi:hypothetical protein